MKRHLAAIAVCLLAVLGGCGSDSKDEPKGSASAAGSPDAALPQSVRSKGELTVASDVSYAPLEYFEKDGKTVTGFDYDLAQALGKKLGVRVRFVNTAFDGIIPALQAGRFDAVMSAMTDTSERERVLDFVNYLDAGTSIVVKRGNPKGISDLDDLCGKTVALQKGTIQADAAKEISAGCEKRGAKGVDIKTFPKDTDAILQVRSGRAVADLNDSPVAAYNAKTSKDLEVVDAPIYGAEPYGIGVKKGNAQLRDALRKALQELIDDGTYTKVITKYGMRAGAVERATVNRGG